MTSPWFRNHLVDDLLPRWLQSSADTDGAFVPHLDRAWRRTKDAPLTLVSQSRLLFNFATGYRLTGEERYLEAVDAGARFLMRHFRDERHGVWRWSVARDGTLLDASLSAYGHAFVIFGLSHAFAATRDDAYRDAAGDVADCVASTFSDAHDGIVPMLDADLRDTGAVRSQNPIMHLFEALTALSVETQSEQGRSRAQALAEWVLDRLVRRSDGVLPELFDKDWRELPEADGGRVDIGHQFEWAYQLSRAVELGQLSSRLSARALRAAARMLDAGMRLGYDAERGGVWSPADPDGRLLSTSKGWWEQCEAARAMIHHARIRGRTDLIAPFEATMDLCRRSFIDPVHGGWFMRVDADGSIPNTAKGNEWKVDYHVVGLCAEAIRLL